MRILNTCGVIGRLPYLPAFEIFGHGSESTRPTLRKSGEAIGHPQNLGGPDSMDGPRTLPELESA